MDIDVVESVTKTIGSLALAYPYLRRLNIAAIIDGLTTKGKGREIATGTVLEVLVLNRLAVRPTPISKVSQWAKTQAIEEVYGIAAEALNDDRIGRALDEIHPHRQAAWTTIVLQGTQAYGVCLDQLHRDVTRIAFEGSYAPAPGQEPTGPQITYGFTEGGPDPQAVSLGRCGVICFGLIHRRGGGRDAVCAVLGRAIHQGRVWPPGTADRPVR